MCACLRMCVCVCVFFFFFFMCFVDVFVLRVLYVCVGSYACAGCVSRVWRAIVRTCVCFVCGCVLVCLVCVCAFCPRCTRALAWVRATLTCVGVQSERCALSCCTPAGDRASTNPRRRDDLLPRVRSISFLLRRQHGRLS